MAKLPGGGREIPLPPRDSFQKAPGHEDKQMCRTLLFSPTPHRSHNDRAPPREGRGGILPSLYPRQSWGSFREYVGARGFAEGLDEGGTGLADHGCRSVEARSPCRTSVSLIGAAKQAQTGPPHTIFNLWALLRPRSMLNPGAVGAPRCQQVEVRWKGRPCLL